MIKRKKQLYINGRKKDYVEDDDNDDYVKDEENYDFEWCFYEVVITMIILMTMIITHSSLIKYILNRV